jgi:hypothetical protein
MNALIILVQSRVLGTVVDAVIKTVTKMYKVLQQVTKDVSALQQQWPL